MALQRKPVTKPSEPGYPDSQTYANDRRDFLIKLGITAAGLLGLAGCGSPESGTRSIGTPPPPLPTSTTPAVQPVVQPVAQPVTAMPGAPIPPSNLAQPPLATPQACSPGKPSATLNQKQIPAQPQAYAKGDVAQPALAPAVRPQAAMGGEPTAPLPAKPEAAMPGGAPAPGKE